MERIGILLSLAAILVTTSIAAQVRTSPTMDLLTEGRIPSLKAATGWLNSPPLTPQQLRGKVVLVQFWTYSCINWMRTQPYVRAWDQKYRNKGLVVIGVHSPEFEFERSPDNVRRATRDANISYPVAIDSDHGLWQAFGNQYWPALYFVDKDGRIRHHQFGEGGYERSERVIQQLLAEAGAAAVDQTLVAADARGAEAPADWGNLKSPENYLGDLRTVGFESPGKPFAPRRRAYTAPARLALNHWALSGDWTKSNDSVSLNSHPGRIVYRFHARDLHIVMGPAKRGTVLHFRVLLDGKPPGQAHGIDIDEQGNGTVSEPRMYQLIRQTSPISERTFEIEFLDPGVEAFSFTFG